MASTRRQRKNLILILAGQYLTIVLFVAVTEAYFRLTHPFIETHWPTRFDPSFGYNFEPGATIRWTNHVDFWSETKANSLGFLDREPPSSKLPNTCRVAFLGDSFVEAAQVDIDRKLQVIFEQKAREQFPNRNLQTMAFGFSGTGQTNQLAFYDVFAKPMQPDVVVLVFVNNDFANNSSVLEGVRNGWHPMHTPRQFLKVDPDSRRFTLAPIDPTWHEHQLSVEYPKPRKLHANLLKHSYFYNWLFTQLSSRYPRAGGWLSGRGPVSKLYTQRMRAIEKLSGMDGVFEGWRYPDDLDFDALFFAEDPLPPVFREALNLTGHTLDEFRGRAQEDGFELIVLAAYGLSTRDFENQIIIQRRLVDQGYLRQLDKLLSERDVPLVSQYDYIISQGGDIKNARFSRDGHWSEQGHEWAAEALLDYFTANPNICSSQG